MLDIFYSKSQDKKTAQNIVFEFCSTNLESVIQEHKDKKEYIPMSKIRSYMK